MTTPTNQAQTIPSGKEPLKRLLGTTGFELEIARVINGRKYGTSTATLACVISCVGSSQLSDFHFERTGLYLSRRGQWFVAGQGGACSRWGRRSTDRTSRVPSEGLELISQTEARRLLEQHNGAVEAYFGCEEG